MIASLAKLADWLFIQKSCGRTPAFNRQASRLDEAIQFLNGLDFIPAESQPAHVEFNSGKPASDFRFPTPRPGSFAETTLLMDDSIDAKRAGKNGRQSFYCMVEM